MIDAATDSDSSLGQPVNPSLTANFSEKVRSKGETKNKIQPDVCRKARNWKNNISRLQLPDALVEATNPC